MAERERERGRENRGIKAKAGDGEDCFLHCVCADKEWYPALSGWAITVVGQGVRVRAALTAIVDDRNALVSRADPKRSGYVVSHIK